MSNIVDLLENILPVSLGMLSFIVSLIAPVIINALRRNDTQISRILELKDYEVLPDDLEAKERIELLEKKRIEKNKDEN